MQSCLQSIPVVAKRVFVAYSGGLDSSVLLHLAVNAALECPVVAWHFNHGLIDAAAEMERFCIDQADNYGIEIRVDHIEFGDLDSNIEAEARKRRYRLLQQHSTDGDVILTAHHADDQAETFILNALRGSGSTGLRGIARQRALGDALLIRPLIDMDRSRLESYADRHELSWFDDPSNALNRFDRNYLRNEIMPLLKERWPHTVEALSTCTSLQAEIHSLVDEIAAQDFTDLAAAPSSGIETLQLDGLMPLSPARRKNLLRHWVAQAGFEAIPRARLKQLEMQLHAGADACPEIAMPYYSIRIYDRRLFLVSTPPPAFRRGEFEFGQKGEIEIKGYNLKLKREAIFAQVEIADRGQSLTLKFRDRDQPSDDKHRLKRLFQRHRIPPWERQNIALVYLDGRLEGILR